MKKDQQISDLVGESFDLKSLVDYQKNSIVSRTLIDKESGTLTVFAYDKGQTVSENTSPHTALAQVIEGKGKFIIEEEEHIVEEGKSVAIPPKCLIQ